jgi:hypothetical protein
MAGHLEFLEFCRKYRDEVHKQRPDGFSQEDTTRSLKRLYELTYGTKAETTHDLLRKIANSVDAKAREAPVPVEPGQSAKVEIVNPADIDALKVRHQSELIVEKEKTKALTITMTGIFTATLIAAAFLIWGWAIYAQYDTGYCMYSHFDYVRNFTNYPMSHEQQEVTYKTTFKDKQYFIVTNYCGRNQNDISCPAIDNIPRVRVCYKDGGDIFFEPTLWMSFANGLYYAVYVAVAYIFLEICLWYYYCEKGSRD